MWRRGCAKKDKPETKSDQMFPEGSQKTFAINSHFSIGLSWQTHVCSITWASGGSTPRLGWRFFPLKRRPLRMSSSYVRFHFPASLKRWTGDQADLKLRGTSILALEDWSDSLSLCHVHLYGGWTIQGFLWHYSKHNNHCFERKHFKKCVCSKNNFALEVKKYVQTKQFSFERNSLSSALETEQGAALQMYH